MELKSFVKLALNDVMDAIEETIRERVSNGKHGYINPKVHTEDEMEIDTIKFDIAVSASAKKHDKVGGSLNVLAAKVGGHGQTENENSEVSRIEFTLGVSWPHTSIEDAKRLRRASSL